jgi:outer membrane protein assembly factor BamB
LYKLDPNGSLLWSYDANCPLISAASLGVDGTAYVGGECGRLFAVDVNGQLRWSHTTGGMVYSSPAVSPDGNSIYVGSEDGKIYALGRDGSEKWEFSTSGFGVFDGAVFASPSIGDDGTVYVGGLYDSNLYALDPNGSTKWTCHFDSEGWLYASPVIAEDGTIYQTLLYDPYLYAIDPNNGSILWSVHLSPICRTGEEPYLDSYSDWFVPYYYEDSFFSGSIMWCGPEWECGDVYINAWYNVSDSGWFEPVLGADGTIYAGFDDPWLRVVEPNGTIRKIMKLGSSSGYDLTAGNAGLLYGVSNDSNMYVANSGGIEMSRFDSNDHWLGFPVVSEGNTVLVGDSRDNSMLISYSNNRVIALGPDGCGEDLDLRWQGGPQDLNADLAVDYEDISILAADWLRCTFCTGGRSCGNYCNGEMITQMWLIGDINRDRRVDGVDFALLAEKWQAGE